MRRVVLLATVVPFVLALGTAQAEAKGCPPPAVGVCYGDPISLRAVITGPGLDEPIVIEGPPSWQGHPFPLGGLLRDSWPYGEAEIGSEAPAPDPETLGPRYRIVYWFDDHRASQQSFQDLYPYAPGRPMVYTGPGWPLVGPGVWWSAPGALRTSLIAYGLPSTPPRARTASEHVSQLTPEPAVDSSLAWVALAALAGLVALLILGAMAGRRRSSSSPRTGSQSSVIRLKVPYSHEQQGPNPSR